uniref:Cell division cycle protein 23 homolog (Trinotate prediction) n=1 Tax=Henneguya salminicola TaxID=69463 RepID=A0A6G3ME78_HENSL
MKDFYILEVEKKLGVSKLNKQNWDNFSSIGFSDTLYIKSSMAIKHKSLNLIDRAKNIYEEIFELDPYSVEHVDTFSNILYLHQDITRLSKLVRETVAYARYKPETCYAIGNLYNVANLHSEASIYFRQSLLLNSTYTPAWTLLGHEFIELKNIPSAMAAYKRAIG